MAVAAVDGSSTGGHVGPARFWLAQRSAGYLLQRTATLGRRYGATPHRAEGRTRRFVELLARHGHAPTLAVPGSVVARHGRFIRELRDLGVDLAVHSFDHVDFRGLTQDERRDQLSRAIAAFDAAGIPVTGFRCPYLGYRPAMRADVPARLRYSSNRALRSDIDLDASATDVYDALERFYDPQDLGDGAVLPDDVGGLLELPVSLPDDLQLLDGLGLDAVQIGRIWTTMLDRSRARGDLFVALAHPETADVCGEAFSALLDRADAGPRPTWVATLSDIAEWWRERETFTVVEDDGSVLLPRDPRATVLTRAVEAAGPVWQGRWRRACARRLPVDRDALPFVGLVSPHPELRRMLQREGYVVRTGSQEGASRCATVIDPTQDGAGGRTQRVLDHIESLDTPLLRFWRWPDGATSCLSVTGDLDALSLVDYATRLRLLRRSRPGLQPVDHGG